VSPAGLDALLAHPLVARVTRTLAARPGALATPDPGARLAAVALVFRLGEGGEPELLFIRRAERTGDPWSGHVAFPGGRMDPGDASLTHTAIRETAEETGIDLARDGVILGQLDDLQPRAPSLPPVLVRPFVAAVGPDVELTLNYECAAAFWVPLAWLRDPASRRMTVLRERGAELQVYSYQRGEHLIWGMTERMLQQLVGIVAESEEQTERAH
jgi:8-oxo-dGTP pyrophosphatase MutT (NUDIX family)